MLQCCEHLAAAGVKAVLKSIRTLHVVQVDVGEDNVDELVKLRPQEMQQRTMQFVILKITICAVFELCSSRVAATVCQQCWWQCDMGRIGKLHHRQSDCEDGRRYGASHILAVEPYSGGQDCVLWRMWRTWSTGGMLRKREECPVNPSKLRMGAVNVVMCRMSS